MKKRIDPKIKNHWIQSLHSYVPSCGSKITVMRSYIRQFFAEKPMAKEVFGSQATALSLLWTHRFG